MLIFVTLPQVLFDELVRNIGILISRCFFSLICYDLFVVKNIEECLCQDDITTPFIGSKSVRQLDLKILKSKGLYDSKIEKFLRQLKSHCCGIISL